MGSTKRLNGTLNRVPLKDDAFNTLLNKLNNRSIPENINESETATQMLVKYRLSGIRQSTNNR